MSGQPPNSPNPSPNPPELEEAILELQQYLSDSVPPLVVADSIQLLLKYPPEAVLPTIRAWTAAQYRGGAGGGLPVSDYLFHALKKIHMMSEFKLVPFEPMNAYLAQLKPIVMSICPAEDREILAQNLSRLGETTTTSASVSPVQQIHRQMESSTVAAGRRSAAAEPAGSSSAPSSAGGASAEGSGEAAVRGLKRFSLFLERLEAAGGLGGPLAGAPVGGVIRGGVAHSPGIPLAAAAAPASEALAFAARSAHSKEELEQTLARLKTMGVDTGTDNLFRALSFSVPGWVLPPMMAGASMGAGAGVAGAAPQTYEAGAIGAMRRIITEAEDPAEAAKRFHEMVKTGVERFNEGSLPQAVQMLELADRLVSEKKVDAGSAEIARRKVGEALDPERLKKFAENSADQPQLRKLLQFFTAYQPEGLLEALPGEQKRDRRRLMLLLLEIHGTPARDAAYERLTHSLGPAVGEEEWYFRRNLLYLLRRIPRSSESQPLDSEIDLVLQHARLGLPMVVLKEAVAALGQLKDEKTEIGLAQLMNDIEEMLIKPENAPYDAKELRALLDRVAATLARLPSRPARRTLIEHAARKQAPLGDTMSRLGELGTQNLADDSATVDQLLGLIKANLPFKVLGMTLRQNDQNLVNLVDALSGTPTPAVRKAFEEIIAKFPDKDAARAATRSIGAWDKPAAAPAAERASATSGSFPSVAREPGGPAASLQGDLDVFGLPALLQSLAESSASGSLTLREPKGGTVFASVTLREGKLEEIKRGKLSGEEAFYQLFEKPVPGQFAFVKGAPKAAPPGVTAKPILPLTLEAMRRYDELQEAVALVPDTMFLVPAGPKPTPHPGEKDGSFLQALWQRANKGGTPLDLEEAVVSDSYRIRRILAHWVEEGSLKPRA